MQPCSHLLKTKTQSTRVEKGVKLNTMANLGLIAGLIGGTTVIIGLCVAVAAYNDGYHEIEDGYVGVYFKHGVLQDEINGRGEHYKEPFVTNVTSVIIRPEVANISDVEAVTKDGVKK